MSQYESRHEDRLAEELTAADPGSDIACRIEALSHADWKAINAEIDRRYGGFFVSGLNQNVLPWRGEHQLAALSVFETDPGIDGIEVSPERITLMVEGKKRSYVPAFRIRRGAATAMVDILHRGQEKHPLRPMITEAIRIGYARIGRRYCALPERRVFAQPRLGNARFVLEYRGVNPSASAQLAVVRQLGQAGRQTVASVVASLPDLPGARDALLSMAARRMVKVDLWAATPGEMQVGLLSWNGLS